MRSLILSVFLLGCQLTDGLKIVIFAPAMANSQIIFNARVADILAAGGHNVTMLKVTKFKRKPLPEVKMDPRIRVMPVNAEIDIDGDELQEKMQSGVYKEYSALETLTGDQMKMYNKFTDILVQSCEVLLNNTEFRDWLKAEKFDLAFTHMYTFCPIGIIHDVSFMTLMMKAMMMMAADKLNFVGRLKSLIGTALMKYLYPRMIPNRETAIFRRLVDPNFPDLIEIASKAPAVFVNSDEMIEPPRPTLHKIVYIGGVGMKKANAKPLTGDYAKIADRAKGMILFSFGSGANASHMPLEWKRAFLDAFAEFPEIEFLLRYDGTDLKDVPKNVYLSKWLPQADLLRESDLSILSEVSEHPKTKAFISHGGYNSVQEAINAGVPLITLGLLGDQPKNSMIAEMRGISVNLHKSDVKKEKIAAAIKEITTNNKYKKAIQKIGAMVEKKPIAIEQRILEWTAFVGEFKTLENLIPHAIHLSFVEYHNLDVFALLFIALLIVVFLVVKIPLLIIRWLKRKILGDTKSKKE